jgi:hypothetical protein
VWATRGPRGLRVPRQPAQRTWQSATC